MRCESLSLDVARSLPKYSGFHKLRGTATALKKIRKKVNIGIAFKYRDVSTRSRADVLLRFSSILFRIEIIWWFLTCGKRLLSYLPCMPKSLHGYRRRDIDLSSTHRLPVDSSSLFQGILIRFSAKTSCFKYTDLHHKEKAVSSWAVYAAFSHIQIRYGIVRLLELRFALLSITISQIYIDCVLESLHT